MKTSQRFEDRPEHPEFLHGEHQPAQQRGDGEQAQQQRQQAGAADLRAAQGRGEPAGEDLPEQRRKRHLQPRRLQLRRHLASGAAFEERQFGSLVEIDE